MRGRHLAAAAGAYLGLALVVLWWGGAYSNDLGSFDDESSHVVTGLLVRDWILAGFPAPLAYARDYYLHYPKVAIGQWPPGFYVLQALWTVVCGASVVSLVTLMGVLQLATAESVTGVLS